MTNEMDEKIQETVQTVNDFMKSNESTMLPEISSIRAMYDIKEGETKIDENVQRKGMIKDIISSCTDLRKSINTDRRSLERDEA